MPRCLGLLIPFSELVMLPEYIDEDVFLFHQRKACTTVLSGHPTNGRRSVSLIGCPIALKYDIKREPEIVRNTSNLPRSKGS